MRNHDSAGHKEHMGPTHVQSEPMLRPIDTQVDSATAIMKKTKSTILFVYVFLVALGVGTGYLLASKTDLASMAADRGAPIKTAKVVGVSDAVFKDCANGVIEAGGLEGEGTHKLIREGGPSQTAYLISSVVDMDQYVGLEVKVCGQTMAAKKVSWLMDVGRLELQE